MATAKLKRKPRLSKFESHKAANCYSRDACYTTLLTAAPQDFGMLGVFYARFPPREASKIWRDLSEKRALSARRLILWMVGV